MRSSESDGSQQRVDGKIGIYHHGLRHYQLQQLNHENVPIQGLFSDTRIKLTVLQHAEYQIQDTSTNEIMAYVYYAIGTQGPGSVSQSLRKVSDTDSVQPP